MKVGLVRVVELLFTKLYNVSHFARIPAVPLRDLRAFALSAATNDLGSLKLIDSRSIFAISTPAYILSVESL